MLIESTENKKIKEIIKLRNKKYRDETGFFIVETEHLIEEAHKIGVLKTIFKLDNYKININVETYDVSLNVMKKISMIESSKVIGICFKIDNKEIIGSKILMLDNVQDPGNVGTIIRSSLGFNVDTIVLGIGTCDIYNDKVIRATEGAIFNINIVKMPLEDAIKEISKRNISIYGTNVNSGINVCDIKEKKYALIVGNEGNGISDNISNLIDKNIYIETNSSLESLNVGVATSILLYELNKE